MNGNNLAIFENYKIRRHYDDQNETWYFSVVDIVQVLIQQPSKQGDGSLFRNILLIDRRPKGRFRKNT